MKKKKIISVLLEVLCELIITVVCFGIGALIISLFGVDYQWISENADLIILIGVAVFIIVFVAIYATIQKVKGKLEKLRRKDDNEG
ncbi:MAG: hypothetical protein J6B34_06290 [Clostridia bacterium]|nr:hypothetical protein [Clostridia bacterium]